MEQQGATNALATAPSRQQASSNPDQTGPGVVVDRIEDGLVGIVLPDGAQFTAAHTSTVKDQLLAVCNGKPCGLLLRLDGVASIDRNAVTGYGKAATVTALALVGSTPVDRVMANRILRITSPQCPTGYFTDVHEALAWLRSHRTDSPNTKG
ncbi:hypothetical protein R5O87_22230 [Arthrobacter globiformis]|uniref:DUF7793 family protein n=1 Tax=Arthrobacter globiformis TaxID=1665 RepID=UPI00397D2173